MPTSSLAQEMKKKNMHDQVGPLFKGQDHEETVTTRRRLKDQRKAEIKQRYEASLSLREESDPARIVMSNAYRQQYDEGVEIPLVKNLVGGRYYDHTGGIVNELGQPHGMSARMSGRSGARTTAGSPTKAPPATSSSPKTSEGVQVATVGRASIRGDTPVDEACGNGDDEVEYEDISAPEHGAYAVPAQASNEEAQQKKVQVPLIQPFPQDDSHDFFGKKLGPKPSVLNPSPVTKIPSRSVGVGGGASVKECGGGGLFRAESAGPPKVPKTYNYDPPRHPDAPTRTLQTTTDIQGGHAWAEAKQLSAQRLPKTGGQIGFGAGQMPGKLEPQPRPQTASSGVLPGTRAGRHGQRPLDTCKFLF